MAIAAKAITLHLHHIAHHLLSWRELSKVVAWTALRMTVGLLLRLLGQRGRGRQGTVRRTEEREREEGEQAGGEEVPAAPVPSLSASLMASLSYSPSFSSPSLHPCVHAGGSGVLKAIQRALKLSEADMEVSRRILFERGNVSSSSVFYQMQLLMLDLQRSRGGNKGGNRRGNEQQREGRGEDGVARVEGRVELNRPLRRGDAVWLLAFGSGFKVNSALLRAL